MSIGSQVQALRIAQGMNKTALANRLGVSTTAVWNWEEENTTPRPHLVPKIAEALGVSVQSLLKGGTEEPADASAVQNDRVLDQAKAEPAVAAQIDRILRRATAEILETIAADIRRA
jgi:transcriptional regulator with XRE-family HTH domain